MQEHVLTSDTILVIQDRSLPGHPIYGSAVNPYIRHIEKKKKVFLTLVVFVNFFPPPWNKLFFVSLLTRGRLVLPLQIG